MVGNARRLYLAHYDRVIPAGIDVHNSAFDISESVLEKRRSMNATAISCAFKPILVPRSETP
jgi:hypothetical protein